MSHLTLEQRYSIQLLWQNGEGISQAAIAERIGKSRSVISRELSRNKNENGRYIAQTAMKKYRNRRHKGSYKIKGELLKSIKSNLKRKRSPEQIANTLKDQEGNRLISHEAVYEYIYAEKVDGGTLYKHLRCSHKKRRKRLSKTDKRGKIPNRVGIEKRPECVQAKERFGDWEGDTIIGARHQGAILTLTERKSKYELIAKLDSLQADHVEKVVIETLKKSKMPVHSITFDNGREFTNHQKIAKALKTEVFFANPYSPWERGLNENTNGLIRQFIPKSQNIKELDEKFIKSIQFNLNHRPRKDLDFLSPVQYYKKYAA
ncbi:MAG: IS30 family transposase [Spirosomaceae bacterium]|jgi:IS30 family transposase|nr:IS30 family transposase [Spirosomataceae bacterium]